MPTIEELTGPIGLIFNLQARINAVVFTVRQSTRGEAVQLLDMMVEELKASSLHELLNQVGQWEAVLTSLQRLREAIVSNQNLRAMQQLAESLKALLDEAVQKLSKA